MDGLGMDDLAMDDSAMNGLAMGLKDPATRSVGRLWCRWGEK